MPDLTPREHLQRFSDLRAQANQFRLVWDEVQRLVVPWRDPINRMRTTGDEQTEDIYDSTAIHAHTIATAALHGMTTPSSTQWVFYEHPDPALAQEQEVKLHFETAAKGFMRALQASNFNQVSQELDADLLAFGTGAMFMEVKPPKAGLAFPGFQFTILAPGTYCVAENADGVVDTIYRAMQLSCFAIYQRWGQNSGQAVLKCYEQKQFDQKFWVVHAVTPRVKNVRNENDLKVPHKRRPFSSFWLLVDRSDGNTAGSSHVPDSQPHVLREEGYFEFPFMVPRWRKMSGEVYGRSPVMDSLPDIRTLNKAVEFRLRAWALALGPPIFSRERGVIGDILLEPFGRSYTQGPPQEAVFPLQLGSNFDVANFQEEQLRSAIRAALFIDQIQTTQSLGLTPKSATEVSLNFEMMTRILGPVANRLQPEYLAPLASNGYRMMVRHGAFEEEGFENTVVQYIGPLARAQSIQEVDAISRFMQIALPISELKPEVLTPMDFTQLGTVLAQATSVPAAVLKTRDRIEAEIEQQVRNQQAQQQQSDALAAAEVVNKVSPAVTQRQ